MKTAQVTRELTKLELVNEIIGGDRPICLHALGQPLVDLMTEVIRDQQIEITKLKKELESEARLR